MRRGRAGRRAGRAAGRRRSPPAWRHGRRGRSAPAPSSRPQRRRGSCLRCRGRDRPCRGGRSAARRDGRGRGSGGRCRGGCARPGRRRGESRDRAGARPTPSRASRRDEIAGEPLGRGSEIGGVGDRLGEAEPHPPGRRLAERRQRLGQVAVAWSSRRATLSPKRRASASRGIANSSPTRFEPDPAQPGERSPGRGAAPRPAAAPARRAPARAAGSTAPLSAAGETRQGPGGAERVGDGDAVRDALAREPARRDRRRVPPRRPTDGPSR